MEFTAGQIAELLNGDLTGDPDRVLNSLSKIEEGIPGSISFLANPKYEAFLYSTEASLVILNRSQNVDKAVKPGLLFVDDAYTSFSVLLEKFNPSEMKMKSGVEEHAFVNKEASIGEGIYIGAFSYISKGVIIGKNTRIHPQVYIGENVRIGEDCILFPGVKVYESCEIGNRVIIHSGTVVGSDGFGFAPQPDGTYAKISQIGNVVIEDDVEIGSNTCIDRATVGSTFIRKGVKLDNLLQVAHNVEIGANTVIAAQTGISGSTKIGENSMIGGQVGLVGHLSIAKGSQIGAQSGIGKSIKEENTQHRGSPSMPYRDALKSEVLYRNFPAIEKRIAELEKLIKELSQHDLQKNS